MEILKKPGNNGTKPREEIQIGRFYITKFEDIPDSVWIENEQHEGMEVPEAILVLLLKNFWEANF